MMNKTFPTIVVYTIIATILASTVRLSETVAPSCIGAFLEDCIPKKPHSPENQNTDSIGGISTLSPNSSGPRTFTVDAFVKSHSKVKTTQKSV